MNKRLQIYLFAIIALFSASLSGMQITYTTTVKDEILDDGSIKRIFTTKSSLNDKYKIEYWIIIRKDAPTAKYNLVIDAPGKMVGVAITNILLSAMMNIKNIAKAGGVDIDMRDLMPESNMISLSSIADASDVQSADPVKLQQQLLAQMQSPAPAQAAAAPIHPAQQAAAAAPVQPARRAPIVAQAEFIPRNNERASAPSGLQEKKERPTK